MPAPDSPARPDDDRRLAALHDYVILDTDAEAGFDDIVRLASHICQTPVALVSLVERDRQWFKARVGFEACETPIEQSVCQHALRQTDLLIIPDLKADPRTAANTLVTEPPHIRFYAGAPLVTPSGAIIGTLCVIDQVPRPEGLAEAQQEMLLALGRQVIHLLELRKAMLDVAEETAHHRDRSEMARDEAARVLAAEEAGGVGTFALDIATGHLQVSGEFCRLFGLPEATSYHSSLLEQLVLPEDAAIRSSAISRQAGNADPNVVYRIRRKNDGHLRWISRRARFVMDADGLPEVLTGTVQDVTDIHTARLHQTALIELGDRLRETTTTADATAIAGEVLGRTLASARAGYAVVNEAQGTLRISRDWAGDTLPSMAGEHALTRFPLTLRKLGEGETLAVANIASAGWLGDDAAAYAEARIAAMIDIPLVEAGRLVGVAFVHEARARTWTRSEIDFAHGVADRAFSTIAQIEAEHRQELLNRELGHRMKNQLAMVQAIVNQSLRSAPDVESATQSITARIQVLAGAHDILLSGATGRTGVGQIVRKVMVLHDDQWAKRFEIEGAEIMVASRPALSLSLILHELSTNATKYGALSVPDGKVKVAWRINRNEEGQQFVLHWSEHNGPTVTQPQRVGSGSRLIRAGLSGVHGGSVTVRYEEQGVTCEIVAELSSFQTEQ